MGIRRLLDPGLAVALVLGLAGCAPEGSQPGAAEPGGSPTPLPSAPEPAPQPPAPDDPVRFPGSTGPATCFEVDGDRRLLRWEDVRFTRELLLRGVDLVEADGSVGLGVASIARKPAGEVLTVGAADGDAPPADARRAVGWADRVPLTDAPVRPGTYYLFLPVEVSGEATVEGLDLQWTDPRGDGVEGSSRWQAVTRYRQQC